MQLLSLFNQLRFSLVNRNSGKDRYLLLVVPCLSKHLFEPIRFHGEISSNVQFCFLNRSLHVYIAMAVSI